MSTDPGAGTLILPLRGTSASGGLLPFVVEPLEIRFPPLQA